MIDHRHFGSMSLFAVFREIIETRLKDAENYLNQMDIHLSSGKTELEKAFEDASKDFVEEDDGPDLYSFFENNFHNYEKIFPSYTYNSMLLSLYGFFEHWLKRLCELDSRKKLSGITIKDMAGGNYIEKSRQYFIKVAGLDLSSVEREWNDIKTVQRLRNSIAHNNASIYSDSSKTLSQQDLFLFVTGKASVTMEADTGDFFINDKSLLLEIIETFRRYFNAIIPLLQKRKVVAQNSRVNLNEQDAGKLKAQKALQDLINCQELTDTITDSELKRNIEERFTGIAAELTFFYAFFCNGEWEAGDAALILAERSDGLRSLGKAYHDY